jgi:hypothetical protein
MIYIVFSLTQIIIDIVKGLYNTAFMKIIVMTIMGFLLNILCLGGLGIISWIIVFIPFVLMTIITAMLLYAFGLNATTGKMTPTPPPLPKPDTPTDEAEIPIESQEQQEEDPRCFVVPSSSTQLHGMRPSNISEDEVFCPWPPEQQ